MSGLQSSRSGMPLNVVLKLFCMLCTHSGEDVRGASRERGLAEPVMRNRILRNRVVRRVLMLVPAGEEETNGWQGRMTRNSHDGALIVQNSVDMVGAYHHSRVDSDHCQGT